MEKQKKWSEQEEEILNKLLRENRQIQMKNLYHLWLNELGEKEESARSLGAFNNKVNAIKKSMTKKSAWTKKEEEILKEIVNKYWEEEFKNSAKLEYGKEELLFQEFNSKMNYLDNNLSKSIKEFKDKRMAIVKTKRRKFQRGKKLKEENKNYTPYREWNETKDIEFIKSVLIDKKFEEAIVFRILKEHFKVSDDAVRSKWNRFLKDHPDFFKTLDPNYQESKLGNKRRKVIKTSDNKNVLIDLTMDDEAKSPMSKLDEKVQFMEEKPIIATPISQISETQKIIPREMEEEKLKNNEEEYEEIENEYQQQLAKIPTEKFREWAVAVCFGSQSIRDFISILEEDNQDGFKYTCELGACSLYRLQDPKHQCMVARFLQRQWISSIPEKSRKDTEYLLSRQTLLLFHEVEINIEVNKLKHEENPTTPVELEETHLNDICEEWTFMSDAAYTILNELNYYIVNVNDFSNVKPDKLLYSVARIELQDQRTIVGMIVGYAGKFLFTFKKMENSNKINSKETVKLFLITSLLQEVRRWIGIDNVGFLSIVDNFFVREEPKDNGFNLLTSTLPSVRQIEAALKKLNPMQHEMVIKTIQKNGFIVVRGCYGCGKSTTFSILIYVLFTLSKTSTILITSEQNAAVDEVLEKVLKLHPEMADECVRVGAVTDGVSDDVKNVSINEEVKKRRKEIKEINEKKELGDNARTISTIKKEIVQLKQSMIKRRIIFMTITTAMSEQGKRLEYDYCLIDEASQVPVFSFMSVCRHKLKTVSMVGDIKQNAPFSYGNVSNTSIDTMQEEANISLLNHFMLNTNYPILTLNIQYRAHPLVAEVLQLFYDYQIMNGRDVRNEQDYLSNLSDSSLSKSSQTRVRIINVERSEDCQIEYNFNQKEIDVVMELLRDINAALHFSSAKRTVLVLTPYRKQLRRLEKAIRREKKTLAKLIINPFTVDTSQGKEADIVIFSLVRHEDLYSVNKFLGFLWKDEARLLVPCSRTRDYLFIVGRIKTFIHEPNYRKVYLKCMDLTTLKLTCRDSDWRETWTTEFNMIN
jgi:hypothetical protein